MVLSCSELTWYRLSVVLFKAKPVQRVTWLASGMQYIAVYFFIY